MDLRELIQARLDNRDRERAEAEARKRAPFEEAQRRVRELEARKRAAFEEAQRRVRELEAQHREMRWRTFAPIVGRSGEVTGLDVSPPMLAVARSIPKPNGAEITFAEGNAQGMTFVNESFDLVTCQQGLQFMGDKLRAMREMHRMLVLGTVVLVVIMIAAVALSAVRR